MSVWYLLCIYIQRVHGILYGLNKGYVRLGDFKKIRAHQQNKIMDMPDSEMVVNEEENDCRFEDRGGKNWMQMQSKYRLLEFYSDKRKQ